MGHPYTPTPTALTSVDLPDDGDMENAASVDVAFEELADGLAYINLEIAEWSATWNVGGTIVFAEDTWVHFEGSAGGGGGGGGAGGGAATNQQYNLGGGGGGAAQKSTIEILCHAGVTYHTTAGSGGIGGSGGSGGSAGGAGAKGDISTVAVTGGMFTGTYARWLGADGGMGGAIQGTVVAGGSAPIAFTFVQGGGPIEKIAPSVFDSYYLLDPSGGSYPPPIEIGRGGYGLTPTVPDHNFGYGGGAPSGVSIVIGGPGVMVTTIASGRHPGGPGGGGACSAWDTSTGGSGGHGVAGVTGTGGLAGNPGFDGTIGAGGGGGSGGGEGSTGNGDGAQGGSGGPGRIRARWRGKFATVTGS